MFAWSLFAFLDVATNAREVNENILESRLFISFHSNLHLLKFIK